MKKIQTPILVISLMCLLLLTACSNQKAKELEESKESLTFSNLLNETSQEEVREAMAAAEIPSENIDLFFQNVNDYNNIVEGKSLVKGGFTTIDSLQAEYDIIGIMDMWNAKNPDFIGYNCRITSYELMKDSIKIGKLDTKNSDWLVFDENAIENNPKELFTQVEHEEFKSLYSFIPTESTKDISLHLKKVQEDWKRKEIEFPNKDKKSIISVFFHDEEEEYLFIGHMGLLIPTKGGELLFIEKLSFQEPYQAIKFHNPIELNDYLMNKYDISWNQEGAKPFIMGNDKLLEGYRENQNKIESD